MIKKRFGDQPASTGGKGSVRRNKKGPSKRGATNIPEIQEVNYFNEAEQYIYHRPARISHGNQGFGGVFGRL